MTETSNIDIASLKCDNRKLRILLPGVWDLTHYGHFRLFKSVKDKFPNSTVIVGVSNDKETIQFKGKTVMNETERAETVIHCRWVDEVIFLPWFWDKCFLDKYNIDCVAHDSMTKTFISGIIKDSFKDVKQRGIFIETQRTENISTTILLNRILNDYDEFVVRNLQREKQCKY
eukprot:325510_1